MDQLVNTNIKLKEKFYLKGDKMRMTIIDQLEQIDNRLKEIIKRQELNKRKQDRQDFMIVGIDIMIRTMKKYKEDNYITEDVLNLILELGEKAKEVVRSL